MLKLWQLPPLTHTPHPPKKNQAGALLAGSILADVPNVGKAVAVIEPLTCLFGGMYLGSLGMLLSPVRAAFDWYGCLIG